MADNEDTIRENAKSPKSMRTDMGAAEQHSLPDQIEADRYLRGSDSITTTSRGLFQTKLSPPGTV